MAKWIVLRTASVSILLISAKVALGQFIVEDKYAIFLESRQFTPQQETAEELNIKLESLKNKHCLIQFVDIPSEFDKDNLKAAGIELLAYIPHYAWYSKIYEGNSQGILGVRYVSDIETIDKISPHILEKGIVPKGRIDEENIKINAVFFDDAGDEETDSLISEYGKGEKLFGNTWEVTLKESRLINFAEEDIVQWVDNVAPDKQESLDVVRSRIHANEVQAPPYNLSGNHYVAGMWDVGTLYSHTDYVSRIVAEPDGSPESDHATNVAGVMLGDGTRSQTCGGTAFQWRGIATQAQVVSYDWTDAINEHNSAINSYNIDISQNSWAWIVCDTSWCDWYGYYDSQTTQYDKIVRGIYGKKVTLIGAAGNDGDCVVCQPDLPNFPYGTVVGPIATSKNALSVSGTLADNDNLWAPTSRGPTDDGRIKPDLSAPACKSSAGITMTHTDNCYIIGECGTSFAAPTVSGSVLLMYEDYNNFYMQNPLPSTIRAILYQTVEDLGNNGPDFDFGYGRIDIQRAIDLIREDNGQNLRIIEDQIYHSEVNYYYMNIPIGEADLKVTVVWDDKEATHGPGIKLVNNLDLVLVSPSQTTYYPWILDWNNPGNPATTGVDDRNNMEQVLVDNPDSGVWIARVTGVVIPYAPQLYSFIGDFMLIPGSISGTVTDAYTSDPVAGAFVEAAGTGIGDTTDNNGEYLLEALIADTYNINFSCIGYADTSVTGVSVNWDENTILNVEMRLVVCEYVPGDVNGSGGYNGLDITYGVNFFKGTGPDPMCPFGSCPIPPCDAFFYCGDVNGSCSYNGLDITYGVIYFKGGADPIPCPNCPPVE